MDKTRLTLTDILKNHEIAAMFFDALRNAVQKHSLGDIWRDNSLVFLTAVGLVEGTVAALPDYWVTGIEEWNRRYDEGRSAEEPAPRVELAIGDLLYLKDVVVTPSQGAQMRLDFLLLDVDKVLGITFGK